MTWRQSRALPTSGLQRRLGEVQHAGGSTLYCYGRLGQITRKVQTINGLTRTVRYSYSPSGNLATLVYPDGSIVDYVRDGFDRVNQIGLTRLGQARQVVVKDVAYAAFGPAIGWTYGNGRRLDRSLDLDYRAQAVNDPTPWGLSQSYSYDPVGSIVALKNGSGSQVMARYAWCLGAPHADSGWAHRNAHRNLCIRFHW
jgi:uncharacterized protein RhaS with RHS repeats